MSAVSARGEPRAGSRAAPSGTALVLALVLAEARGAAAFGTVEEQIGVLGALCGVLAGLAILVAGALIYARPRAAPRPRALEQRGALVVGVDGVDGDDGDGDMDE